VKDRFGRIVLIWVLALASAWIVDRLARDWTSHADRPRPVALRGNLGESERQTIGLFESTAPSVAYIFTDGFGEPDARRLPEERAGGAGSGFVWDLAGHVVTNNHVIEGAHRIRVRLDQGEPIEAKLVGTAPDYDLAVLQLADTGARLVPITVGSSSDLRVGQSVFAIGNPFGLRRTLTKGIVSALGRRLPTQANREIADVIQIDAAINPGNSGGPLIDSAGRLIGVTTAILSGTGSFAGVGFAVPVDVINRIVPSLIRDGRVPRPGIGILVAPEELASRLGIAGLVVARVQPDSPAATAGLVGADRRSGTLGDVITHVDGHAVETIADLAVELDRIGIGNKVELTVLRDGRSRLVSVLVTDISS
jgi:2-alkenal reductase